MKEYDTIIIGGGAAGLTAALYTGRKKLKTLIVSIDLGGQTLLTDNIENYPGVDSSPGPELMAKFQSQATKFGAEVIMGEANAIKKIGKTFEVNLSNGEKYSGKTIIVASGKTARKIGAPGEDKFMGRGVSTCATCDAAFFKDKEVVVVGGGNSAFEAAELLTKFAKKIYLVHRNDKFRADEITVEKVKKLKQVEVIPFSQLKEIKGDKFVDGVSIENIESKKIKEVKANGIFIEIGYELKTDWLKSLVKRNDKNEIVIDDRCNTSQKGIFAAGDVSTVPYKQTVISAGEGAKAGLEAYKYINGAEAAIDWK
ncbi:FAD-dependent oxidoreductase [Candidatus Woesearchaeota archaeon]|jgi:thioredoxin reductase (NADPH)|nr:FAD-dependent oxidoreductase [Candidatus Woesearchaeota archaeon]MBT7237383.1 FAD-dependent oxidoreductase [Candidatus Woesearchaeota archaeon]